MKKPFSDQDVLNLLTNLKGAESSYPSEMIESRRDMFMKQAAAMTVLAGAGGNGSSAAGNAQTSASGTATSTAGGSVTVNGLLEIALVVAIVVEAGVATFIYRDKITDFINSTLSQKDEQTANPPEDSSSGVSAVIEETATATAEETGTVTVTVTSVATPTPPSLYVPAGGNGSSNSDAQATATPDPKSNPGLHLGQTKQPTEDPNLDSQNNNSNKDTNKDKNK